MNASDRTWKDYVTLALRLVVGAVFLAAGVGKGLDPGPSFELQVAAFPLVPEAMVDIVTTALPLVEVTVGLNLVLGVAMRVFAPLAAGLLSAFATGLAVQAASGADDSCGCLGEAATLPVQAMLALDFSLLAGAAALAVLVFRGYAAFSVDQVLGPEGASRQAAKTPGTAEDGPGE